MDAAGPVSVGEALYLIQHVTLLAWIAVNRPQVFRRVFGAVLAVKSGLLPAPHLNFLATYFYDFQAMNRNVCVREPVFSLTPDTVLLFMANRPLDMPPFHILPLFVNGDFSVLLTDVTNGITTWFTSAPQPAVHIFETLRQICPGFAAFDVVELEAVPIQEGQDDNIPTVLVCLTKFLHQRELPKRPVYYPIEIFEDATFEEINHSFLNYYLINVAALYPPQLPHELIAQIMPGVFDEDLQEDDNWPQEEDLDFPEDDEAFEDEEEDEDAWIDELDFSVEDSDDDSDYFSDGV